MLQTISEPVSVVFDKFPRFVTWKNRDYEIKKVGLHHKYLKGNTLYHIFSVTTDTIFMRLKLNTKSLTWVLEEFEENINE